MNPFELLASAIIVQAAKDYREALKRLYRNPHDKNGLAVKSDCELFFRSVWFKQLTGVNPEMLIRKLQAEVQEV